MVSFILLMFIGLAGGLAVGSGFVAFLTVLGVIPRLADLTRSEKSLRYYEVAIVLGALAGVWFSLGEPHLSFPTPIVIAIGLLCGMFIGLLAAALTEVLNVFPILAKRIGMKNKVNLLLWAIVLGKILGSLYHWLFFVR
ncbi:stage V sporulation protein AB [Evansella cellulosilytica]|uniref:Stage V sporulation protein AB n=1 Tax=Evansella cellulosilytica (strain ATCC 21833 / DSM 2522 / FERM P-1141 / JCM 9156 / N-4) TaxID=649639 RepID=E6TYK9_EVAC2|nr:stage V sporulation protein AB [Evansella cellulosilytica]ADU30059.1 stage V sporulation protein AB [Evansella cellulosilytica DSM 2522]